MCAFLSFFRRLSISCSSGITTDLRISESAWAYKHHQVMACPSIPLGLQVSTQHLIFLGLHVITYCVTLTVLHFIMGKLSCNTHKKITIITEKSHSYNHIISLHCTHRSTIRYDKTFKIRRSVQIPIRHIYA